LPLNLFNMGQNYPNNAESHIFCIIIALLLIILALLFRKMLYSQPLLKKAMIIVHIKEGENLERSISAFKKKFQRIGIVKELRLRKVYNKPSVVRRQKKLKAILRQKYINSQD